jgi:hypothetical protein
LISIGFFLLLNFFAGPQRLPAQARLNRVDRVHAEVAQYRLREVLHQPDALVFDPDLPCTSDVDDLSFAQLLWTTLCARTRLASQAVDSQEKFPTAQVVSGWARSGH